MRTMKTSYLDDKLCIVVKGERNELRECAKIILLVTNGGTTGHRNTNLITRLFDSQPIILGHYKRERMKYCDDRLVYGFLQEGSSLDAEKAAKNHYTVIKENIQQLNNTYLKQRNNE
jgi:hypothetical protein